MKPAFGRPFSQLCWIQRPITTTLEPLNFPSVLSAQKSGRSNTFQWNSCWKSTFSLSNTNLLQGLSFLCSKNCKTCIGIWKVFILESIDNWTVLIFENFQQLKSIDIWQEKYRYLNQYCSLKTVDIWSVFIWEGWYMKRVHNLKRVHAWKILTQEKSINGWKVLIVKKYWRFW